MLKAQCDSRRPDASIVELVDGCGRDISPDDRALLPWYSGYVNGQSLRVASDLHKLREIAPPGASILEVGSIPLLFTLAASRMGFRVTGLDISPDRFSNTARKHSLCVLKCDIEKEVFPVGNDAADIVVFCEVLEHLRCNPLGPLREMRRVLKPGGGLYFTTPNLRSLRGIRSFLFENRAGSCAPDIVSELRREEVAGHAGHAREYTSTECAAMLTAAGFTVECLRYSGENAGSWLDRALQRAVKSFRPGIGIVARKPA